MTILAAPGNASKPSSLGRAGGLGLVLVSLSTALPPVFIKPNRVAASSALSYADLASLFSGPSAAGPLRSGRIWVIGAVLLLIATLLLALAPRPRPYPRGSRMAPGADARNAALAGAVLGALALILSLGAQAASLRGASFSASAGPGLWLALLGAWFMADASLKERRRELAAMLLAALPGLCFLVLHAPSEQLAVAREFLNRRQRFGDEALRHFFLVLWPSLLAALIGFLAGLVARKRPRFKTLALALSNGVQVIPSLALFGLLMAPLSALSRAIPALREAGVSGSGAAPALIALTAYATLPILRNTIAGFEAVPLEAIDAGQGMGMDERRLFFSIELPLALPLVVRGFRTAFVQSVGNAAVAALIGSGGLGVFVFQGLGESAPALVMLGVLPLLVAATLADRLLQWAEHLARGRGLGERP